MTEKKCSKCGEVKPLDGFGRDRHTKDGLRYNCKNCMNEVKRIYRDKNKEKIRKSRSRRARCNRLKEAEQSNRHTYLITDGHFLKVGSFTDGKLEQRLYTLQTGNPRKLRVLATSASNIEKLCHYEFEDLNVLNEWFKFDLKIVHFFTEHAE